METAPAAHPPMMTSEVKKKRRRKKSGGGGAKNESNAKEEEEPSSAAAPDRSPAKKRPKEEEDEGREADLKPRKSIDLFFRRVSKDDYLKDMKENQEKRVGALHRCAICFMFFIGMETSWTRTRRLARDFPSSHWLATRTSARQKYENCQLIHFLTLLFSKKYLKNN